MPGLPIGTLDDGDTAILDPRRFNRHTFWCGQSGSGKTYALGVVLEQLLLATDLPLLVLDPNADFVGIGEPTAAADAETAEAIRALDVRVLRAQAAEGADGLRVRFRRMNVRSQAAALRLDPLLDPEQYNLLLHAWDAGPAEGREDVVAAFAASDSADARRLALRVENLGVLDWDLWAWGQESAEDVIAQRPRATVLDLSGFGSPDEPRLAALAVLDDLWERRTERRPVLIVIDEAHNLCPPDPSTPLERALTERIVQIAAEGRKYGLWLLLSTQRPTKIHPNVISQCDNLALMKLSSPRDVAELAEIFGAAPRSLVERAPRFEKGQSLFAGGFIPDASIVRMGERLTREGGADVAVPIRADS